MNCSPNEAASFFHKWLDESTLLTVMLSSPTLSLSCSGVVVEFSPDDGVRLVAPVLKTASGEVIQFPFDLVVGFEGALFEYAEPREAPSDIREASEAIITCVLSIKTPGLVLMLSEMENQPPLAQS
jgi:hypothetical protein